MKTASSPLELQTVRALRPDWLLAWLRPAAAYLADHGLILPESLLAPPTAAPSKPSGGSPAPPWPGFDYDRLDRILREAPPGAPAALTDGLFLIQAMANPAGMDILIEGARAHGLRLDLAGEIAPADVAVQLWLLAPRLLEDLHNCHELTRPRAFCYFSTDAAPVPAFSGPSAEQLARLEARLDEFYLAWQRGPGARVFAYRHPAKPAAAWPRWGDQGAEPNCDCASGLDNPTPPLERASPDTNCQTTPDEWWFLIRHGGTCRREGTMEDGRPGTVCFRPQSHDVLVYDAPRGELRLNCCTARERTVLLRLFGRCLFGRNDFFPGIARFTLAPLVRRGRDCLACGDVPGLQKITLTEVEFYFRQEPWKRVSQKACDIFELVERAEVHWPEKIEEITRATFEVKFWRAARPRRLTLVPCNKALYSRDDDSLLLEQWLRAREFVLPGA